MLRTNTSFVELATDDASGATMIVLGLNQDGGAGASLRLPLADFGGAFLKALHLYLALSSTGAVSIQTDAVDEKELYELLKEGALPTKTLDDLVKDMLALWSNDPDAEDQADLTAFAGRLEQLTAAVRDAARDTASKS